ncbi:hypothetical protein [Pseudoxanthomonas sp. J35]|uniref:hypothetical protein n=1 Tax=Pseudoxanthomonas sp. J35 TaxID=935852 RepID=UPI0004B38EA3|nr:hypothetical protein [Pseudoxanthomonas sp. J35]
MSKQGHGQRKGNGHAHEHGYARAKKGAPGAIRRRAVLVVGPPRSGTSAAAQVLNGLGVHFGDPARFVDPEQHKHNPIFFELQSLNDLNDALLAELGVNFGDFDYFPEPGKFPLSADAWLSFEARAEVLISEEFGGKHLIGLKDPRFVFTLPFWDRFFKSRGYEPSFVFVTRAPQAIALSNAKVNKCSQGHNDRLAWLSLHLCAAQLVRHKPALLDFDRLVAEPDIVVGELARSLKLKVPAELRHGIDAGLKHESEAREFVEADIPDMAQEYLARRAELDDFGLLELAQRRREEVRGLVRSNQALTQEITEARIEVRRVEGRLASAMAPLVSELRTGFGRIADVIASVEDEKTFGRSIIQQRIRDLEDALFSSQAELNALRTEAQSLQVRLDRLRQGLPELEVAEVPPEHSAGDVVGLAPIPLDEESSGAGEAGSQQEPEAGDPDQTATGKIS